MAHKHYCPTCGRTYSCPTRPAADCHDEEERVCGKCSPSTKKKGGKDYKPNRAADVMKKAAQRNKKRRQALQARREELQDRERAQGSQALYPGQGRATPEQLRIRRREVAVLYSSNYSPEQIAMELELPLQIVTKDLKVIVEAMAVTYSQMEPEHLFARYAMMMGKLYGDLEDACDKFLSDEEAKGYNSFVAAKRTQKDVIESIFKAGVDHGVIQRKKASRMIGQGEAETVEVMRAELRLYAGLLGDIDPMAQFYRRRDAQLSQGHARQLHAGGVIEAQSSPAGKQSRVCVKIKRVKRVNGAPVRPFFEAYLERERRAQAKLLAKKGLKPEEEVPGLEDMSNDGLGVILAEEELNSELDSDIAARERKRVSALALKDRKELQEQSR
jgi:hypothetical protein